ncbi:hypothetical protein HYW46_01770 [Candidatus Daviesbacteria bacterium]|nr:hypothetical protein [Candidatus Daviesbacteria bacterium]
MSSENVNRSPSEVEKKIAVYRKTAAKIESDRREADEIDMPSAGVLGIVRRLIISNPLSRRLLPDEILESIEQKPIMERVIAEERRMILQLAEDLPNLIAPAKELVDLGESIHVLLAIITGKSLEQVFESLNLPPEAEVFYRNLTPEEAQEQLEETLNAKAEKELRELQEKRNTVSQEFLELLAVREKDDVAEEKQALIEQAEEFLHWMGPFIEVAKQDMRSTRAYFKKLKRIYGIDLLYTELTDGINRSTNDITKAQALGIRSFNTKEGQLDLAIQALNVVADLECAIRQFKRDEAPEILEGLQTRAQDLRQKFAEANVLPEASAVPAIKILPPAANP